MAKFIELHKFISENPTLALVNLDLLESVWIGVSGRTILSFSSKDDFVVQEDYETVKRLILEE